MMLCLLLSACSTAPKLAKASPGTHSAPASDELYLELGGQEGIQAISHRFIKMIAANRHVRARFEKTDIGRFDRMFNEHICFLSGGPCTYTGDTMAKTHGGMNIQSSEFNQMTASLMQAMDAEKVPVTTQNKLLAILARMRPEIIKQ